MMTREERYIEYDKRIDRYLRGLMGDDERKAFEQEVDGNEELRERLVSTSLLVQGIVEEGMRREGQAQLDAIKQMSPDDFGQAIRGDQGHAAAKGNPKPSWWTKAKTWSIIGIAASIALVIGFFAFNPTAKQNPQVMAEQSSKEIKTQSNTVTAAARPTLASLAKEYNRPIAGEPDEFVTIRQQIQQRDSKDMMALVNDIDKIEMPAYNEGAKGAEDADVIREMQQLHADCTHWYKALAYLKVNDKASATKELNELLNQGQNEDLVKRATALLKKLEK